MACELQLIGNEDAKGTYVESRRLELLVECTDVGLGPYRT
jgi:hypothetical protein